MKIEETLKILSTLQTAYPAFYAKKTEEELIDAAKLWSIMFRDESYEAVSAAVYAIIATQVEGYPPTIGAVKEKIYSLTKKEELTEQGAWALVSKACQNGTYGYKKEFDKLPPEIQKAVGTPEQIREWASMDADTVQSVVASNFMRNYRTVIQRKEEAEKIPYESRLMLESLGGFMLTD